MERLRGVLTAEEADELVAFCEAGGWDLAREPVDGAPVVQQTLLRLRGVDGAPCRSRLAPAPCGADELPSCSAGKQLAEELGRRLAPAAAALAGSAGAQLAWAYVKRYREGERVELKEHADLSDVTVNVHLTDPAAYDGAELYVLNPAQSAALARRKREFFAPPERVAAEARDALARGDYDAYEKLAARRMDPLGAWRDEFSRLWPREALLRSAIPPVSKGDGVAHLGALQHGVLPLRRGERFVLIMFFAARGGLPDGRRLRGVDGSDDDDGDEAATVADVLGWGVGWWPRGGPHGEVW